MPFTYVVKGGELFTDRRERSITRSTFEKAFEKLYKDQVGEDAPKKIVGPKTLNVYGAPYVWAVFMGIGLLENIVCVQQELKSGLMADIYQPGKPAFREYSVFFHDELEIKNKDGEQPINPHTGLPSSTTAGMTRRDAFLS